MKSNAYQTDQILGIQHTEEWSMCFPSNKVQKSCWKVGTPYLRLSLIDCELLSALVSSVKMLHR